MGQVQAEHYFVHIKRQKYTVDKIMRVVLHSYLLVLVTMHYSLICDPEAVCEIMHGLPNGGITLYGEVFCGHWHTFNSIPKILHS